jgi:hypothetical protein
LVTLKESRLVFAAGLLVAILCLSLLGLAAAASGQSDEFSGPALSGFWGSPIDPDGGSTFSLSANVGWLRISTHTPPTRDLYDPTFNAPRILQSVTGDFEVVTCVSGDFAGGSPHRGGIVVWASSSDFFRAERKEGSQVHTVYKIAGSMNDGVYQNLPSDLAVTYLKVQRLDSTLTAYWSEDGVTWNTYMTLTGFATASSVDVGLFVIDYGTPFYADFDFFHITASPPSVLPEYPYALCLPIAIGGAFLVFKRKTQAQLS